MAGRGVTISIQVLNTEGNASEMSLPVALHSPLEVLQAQLFHLTKIPVEKQVLILCDMTDPDRNNDTLLNRNTTLRYLGIKNGSVLTLHSISLEETNITETRSEVLKKLFNPPIDPDLTRVDTLIPAQHADHSYNGIIFDVKSTSNYKLEITSVHIAGMLGRIRIFIRDRPWAKDNDDNDEARHYWAYRTPLSTTGWTVVHDSLQTPSWDKPIEIKFDSPLIIYPHERKAIYCHSSLPDDLGIQYQSYQKGQIFARDEHIALIAGLGHTGSAPFDAYNGWYKDKRGLAGSVSYNKSQPLWKSKIHFPTIPCSNC